MDSHLGYSDLQGFSYKDGSPIAAGHGMPLPAIDENYEIDQIQVNRVIAA